MSNVTMSAASELARAEAPRSLGRAVEIPALADLQGPRDGLLVVPRRLYWSSDDQCGLVALQNEDEVALAYEAIIDAARITADLAENLNAELLVRVWSTLGIALARREAREAGNPELAAARATSAAVAA
jgi:hypothetical protein